MVFSHKSDLRLYNTNESSLSKQNCKETRSLWISKRRQNDTSKVIKRTKETRRQTVIDLLFILATGKSMPYHT